MSNQVHKHIALCSQLSIKISWKPVDNSYFVSWTTGLYDLFSFVFRKCKQNEGNRWTNFANLILYVFEILRLFQQFERVLLTIKPLKSLNSSFRNVWEKAQIWKILEKGRKRGLLERKRQILVKKFKHHVIEIQAWANFSIKKIKSTIPTNTVSSV